MDGKGGPMSRSHCKGRAPLAALLVVLILSTACATAPASGPSADLPSVPGQTPVATAAKAAATPENGDSLGVAQDKETPNPLEAGASAGGGTEPEGPFAAVPADGATSQGPLALEDALLRAQPASRGGSRALVDPGAAPTDAADNAALVEGHPSPSPTPRPSQPIAYTVVEGDTLLGLAERFGISLETILWANDLEGKADDLQIGQVLTILPVSGVLHETGRGDTLAEIAAIHSAEVRAIVETNALSDPDAIAVGQRLVVPGGKPVVRKPALPQQSSPETGSKPAAPDPASASAPPAPERTVGGTGKGAQIVAVASRFAGYAYTWGGHSPATGFDCTGFTWYVYGQVGLAIPLHDLWGQLGAGPRIGQSELLPGDLVFFENTYKPGLSHAGIYVGNRTFIHAASERLGVRYDSLDDAYWGPRYFGASRPW